MKHLADSLGIFPVCKFVGLRFNVAELLSAFDVFVLSSVLEGLPRVVIEAMAMARPPVATGFDGVREQLKYNETGLLVSPADPKKLAKAILAIINDQSTAERLAQQARKDAEKKFDLRDTLANVEMMYEQISTLNR